MTWIELEFQVSNLGPTILHKREEGFEKTFFVNVEKIYNREIRSTNFVLAKDLLFVCIFCSLRKDNTKGK